MAHYQITCTVQVSADQAPSHQHIVQIGTGWAAGWSQKWNIQQVTQAKQRGDRFYTVSPSTGKQADVLVVGCDVCGRQILRSSPDWITDNNLDNLPLCGQQVFQGGNASGLNEGEP